MPFAVKKLKALNNIAPAPLVSKSFLGLCLIKLEIEMFIRGILGYMKV
jgi:hypothetical protein